MCWQASRLGHPARIGVFPTLEVVEAVEAYLKAGVRPLWRERVIEVDGGIARERRRLERAWRRLHAECDGADFAARWRATVHGWRFDAELNELIRQHNEWYPIE